MTIKKKSKAGFYLTQKTIDRLEKRYLLLKLEGIPVVKSDLVEIALGMLFDDLSRGDDSTVKAKLTAAL
ncbi:hypothetical protein [Salidesulfovibrio onnuriiensis]|uniref:hypothetical protein n=1 Tax=Salidesulfovibrio onnuriiensis TaxID=2583823 RepID=UPI0011C93C37|nr:hypothetical protein [Salidesulfovibrio onnuriiensis]